SPLAGRGRPPAGRRTGHPAAGPVRRLLRLPRPGPALVSPTINRIETPMPEETVRSSERIRQRLLAAGQRFHANDNIADFIEPGDLEAIQAEVAGHMQQVLKSLVIDVDGDH